MVKMQGDIRGNISLKDVTGDQRIYREKKSPKLNRKANRRWKDKLI